MHNSVASASCHVHAARAFSLESQHSERAHSASQAPQAQPAQAGEQTHLGLAGHDPALLEKKMQGAVPEGRLEALMAQLQALIVQLRGIYVAAPDKAASSHAGDHLHEAHQPNQQPDQPPVSKKQARSYAADRAYGPPRSNGFRYGMGALAGAGLTAGTCGWMRLGGLGLLGATAAVCSVASFGLLGAGLYASYKYLSHRPPNYQNSSWQTLPSYANRCCPASPPHQNTFLPAPSLYGCQPPYCHTQQR